MPPTPLTTEAFQATCDRLFAPFLRPPRNPTFPTPPSLAASRLPPPAAEIDERPSYRVRRFRLWKENAPALRMAVLDPKRRSRSYCLHGIRLTDMGIVQLWRYQSFAIPNVPFPRRGNLAFKWTPPPRPPSVTTQPVQATIPAAPGHPEQTPSTSPPGQIAQPNLAPTQTQLTLAPIQTQPNVTPMRTQPNLPLTQKPQTPSPKIKKTKAERRVLWQRMLQNKYALDQEHERRFRGAMAVLTDNVVGFERKNV